MKRGNLARSIVHRGLPSFLLGNVYRVGPRIWRLGRCESTSITRIWLVPFYPQGAEENPHVGCGKRLQGP
ncbi:unnamed protein product [Ciceribacter sp. T2.26MG-112.2]|nr:unnamed protein product [Ciceribacter naphthalenivorans]